MFDVFYMHVPCLLFSTCMCGVGCFLHACAVLAVWQIIVTVLWIPSVETTPESRFSLFLKEVLKWLPYSNKCEKRIMLQTEKNSLCILHFLWGWAKSAAGLSLNLCDLLSHRGTKQRPDLIDATHTWLSEWHDSYIRQVTKWPDSCGTNGCVVWQLYQAGEWVTLQLCSSGGQVTSQLCQTGSWKTQTGYWVTSRLCNAGNWVTWHCLMQWLGNMTAVSHKWLCGVTTVSGRWVSDITLQLCSSGGQVTSQMYQTGS